MNDLYRDGSELDNEDTSAFEDLELMFGAPEDEMIKMEKTSLTEDLEGFASCFPSWDLHPPVRK